jgi:cysteine-rich repeat protein
MKGGAIMRRFFVRGAGGAWASFNDGRWILVCALLAGCLQSARGAAAVQPGAARREIEFARVRLAAQQDGSARVIVQFDVPQLAVLTSASRDAKAPAEAAAADAQLAAAIKAVRDAELAKLAGTAYRLHRDYAALPFVALTVSPAAIDALERSPAVLGINEDKPVPPSLDNTVNITGAAAAWNLGFDGTGHYVAILDTGIRDSHDFFASKTIVQACFASGDASGPDCPNGTASDTTSLDAARHFPTLPTSDHGTHVAGIAAGTDPGRLPPIHGVAPAADIIAVQVFSQFYNEPTCNGGGGGDCVLSFPSDQAAGLDFVYSLRTTYAIASVNMSLGGGTIWSQSDCDQDNALVKAAIDGLRAVDIATIVSAGNNGACGGLGAPACISSAIAVGATDDADVEASFSQYHPALLDLYAPGDVIHSAVDISDSSYADYSGTSMAAPHVAGAWAILQHARPGADVDTVLHALQSTGAAVTGRCDASPAARRIAIDLAVAHLQLLDPQCTDPPGADPRPLWTDLATPGGTGYPDYQNVTENLQILESLRLFASIVTRAAQKLSDLTSEYDDEAKGRCVCSLTEIQSNVKRKDCTAANNSCSATPTGDYPLWLPTDLFKSVGNAARFTLNFFDFLDAVRDELSTIASALQTLGTDIGNLADLVARFQEYVDEFTEGYHLGGYSTQRPELHLCVGYGGHGAFASMLNLFNEVSIGGRYTSHNLSAEHRAQFRSGGFAVSAFGRSISLLPGIEANIQIDGFRLWDAARPFGIDLSAIGDPTCAAGSGFRISDIEQYDIFHLVDSPTELTPFDTGTPDGCLQPGEFLIHDFYPASFVVGADTYTWPRPALSAFDWERQNTAVFAAGLNLPIEMERIEKYVPPGGILLFPGATLFPKFTMDAGVAWSHRAYGLRDRLKDMVNLNLPANAQLGPADFERPMHFLQAPDVSGDDGTSAFVRPRIAADLVLGIALGRYMTLGITANAGLSVRVEPAAYGGVHDFNTGLTNTLLFSNPPPELPCDPIVESTPTESCSNSLYLDNEGQALSDGDYSCDTSEIVTYHCAKPEDDRTCTPANAAEDCPETQECLPEYGCAAHGLCTRILEPGRDGLEGTDDDVVQVTHDTTKAACTGESVCTEPALNAGAVCSSDADCITRRVCVGGASPGQPCTTAANCEGGACQAPPAPCVPIAPTGYFTAYQCVVHNNPEITGWAGPGCHPLTVGFASACGCASDDDCVAGVETCEDGACAVGGTPVECPCDPTAPTPCGAGRVCEEGACLLDCSTGGAADCAAFQTCVGGVCVNPYGIPFTEQILWSITNTPRPQHAVSTYALSDILASAILDAGLWIGIDLKIFKKNFHIDLLKLSDAWTLAAFNKSWYQAGLEARYQHDCDPVAGNWVTNWQPDPSDPGEPRRVTRYNPSAVTSAYLGNAGTEEDLLLWCDGELPNNVADPASPTTGDIIQAATDVLEWGEQIGIDVWALGGLCVSHPVDTNGDGVIDQLDGPQSKPLGQWLIDMNNDPSGLMCSYDSGSELFPFPCGEVREQLLLHWGCMDVAASPWAMHLANRFNGISDPLNIVTTFLGNPVLDLGLMLIDPAGEFTLDNLKPQIRNYTLGLSFVGIHWYTHVSQCFEQHHAVMPPGTVSLINVSIGPCCGNGSLDQFACGAGPGGTPCEQCDDGNNLPGDGCSPLCRLEDSSVIPGCGDGILQVGFGEVCDDGNQASGDGCEPDCTLTEAGCDDTSPRVPCCINGVLCQILPSDCCVSSGGVPLPVGTVCPPVGSACQTGACCQNNGTCTQVLEAACTSFVCNVFDLLPASFTGCFGDVDGGGVVNAADRGFISANIGQGEPELICRFDLDGNGVINAGDRGFVAANIGHCTPLPDHQNGNGLIDGLPDLRFGPGNFHGPGTSCAGVMCP